MNLPPPNYRLVCAEKSKILYRSEAAYDGDSNSAQWLRETVGIKCYIDCREKDDYMKTSKLDDYFLVREPGGRKLQNHRIPLKHGFRYNFSFFNISYNLRKLASFKLNEILHVVLLYIRHLFCHDFQYRKYGGHCFLNSLRLGNIYCDMLDNCSNVFQKIFSLMTNETNFPMLISCNFGKDRTGIISALVMDLLGCDGDSIIEEYSKSKENLKYLQKELETFFENKGTPKHFIGSPPEAMTEMLRHLKEKYGDAEGYLLYCGMSKDEIEKIKRNITNS